MAEQVTQVSTEVGYNDVDSQHKIQLFQAHTEVGYNDVDSLHIIQVFQVMVEVGSLYLDHNLYWQVW